MHPTCFKNPLWIVHGRNRFRGCFWRPQTYDPQEHFDSILGSVISSFSHYVPQGISQFSLSLFWLPGHRGSTSPSRPTSFASVAWCNKILSCLHITLNWLLLTFHAAAFFYSHRGWRLMSSCRLLSITGKFSLILLGSTSSRKLIWTCLLVLPTQGSLCRSVLSLSPSQGLQMLDRISIESLQWRAEPFRLRSRPPVVVAKSVSLGFS